MIKKIVSLILFGVLIVHISSCDGLIKDNEISFNSPFQNDTITLKFDKKVSFDRGMNDFGVVCFKTDVTIPEIIDIFQNDISLLKFTYYNNQFIQIDGKGIYAMTCDNSADDTKVMIYSMSITNSDSMFPFPLYSLYEENKFISSVNFISGVEYNHEYKMVDFDYTKKCIFGFNDMLNIYSRIEENEDTIKLSFKDDYIVLNYDSNTHSLVITHNKNKLS